MRSVTRETLLKLKQHLNMLQDTLEYTLDTLEDGSVKYPWLSIADVDYFEQDADLVYGDRKVYFQFSGYPTIDKALFYLKNNDPINYELVIQGPVV